MGDDRDNSLDSRAWGFVPRDLVIGRAMFVYWSYDETKPFTNPSISLPTPVESHRNDGEMRFERSEFAPSGGPEPISSRRKAELKQRSCT